MIVQLTASPSQLKLKRNTELAADKMQNYFLKDIRVSNLAKKPIRGLTGEIWFSYPIRGPFPGLFDQSLIHSQDPILLCGLQSSLHLLPPHLQLDMQTLKGLMRKKKRNLIPF